MHHIQSSYKTIPYTLNIGYRSLTSQLQQNGINRAGQPLAKILVRLYEGQKKPVKKNPFGEKIRQEIWVGTIAQTLSSLQPILRGFALQPKYILKLKKKLGISQRLRVGSEGRDGNYVPYSLLYTTASLPIITHDARA